MYSNKHIVKISAPILLSLLAQNIIQVIDTAFLGRVGEVELGASALAGVIYIALYTLGFGFSMGAQILIGRRNGEKNYDKIGDIVIQGSIFLLIPAILLIPLVRYGSVHWLPLIFESADVANAVIEYLQWRVFGIVFAFVNLMFRAFYIGTARTRVLTVNAVVMAVANVIFDYGLIFGKLGMPEMGMAGAGIASVIAEFTSFVFLLLYTRKTVNPEKYGFNKIGFQSPRYLHIYDGAIPVLHWYVDAFLRIYRELYGREVSGRHQYRTEFLYYFYDPFQCIGLGGKYIGK